MAEALRRTLVAAVVALACAAVTTFAAEADVVPDCEAMAARIGAAEGLPEGLLPAIARIESGRRVGRTVRAWPWTLNHAGRGLYFETRAEALAYLRQTVAEGPRNIDVGCMQVNHYWHGANFPSVEVMIDPETNIRYAIRFLKELYVSKGSWEAAVKHYHSPDPDRGARYHRAFETARAAIDPDVARRGDVMSASGAATLSRGEAMRAGGLFGQALMGSRDATVPYGAIVTTDAGAPPNDATENAYAALLALLAERDGAALSFLPTQVDLAATSASPVLRKNWSRIEAFREMLKADP
ncbi:transglycosylase SLT domain-containing protein [Rhodobacterales bacterium LSUCC0031]|nr:transglycosylase SLT domain-containing protein [Rhodobacterales bacterium LSUCC0031]